MNKKRLKGWGIRKYTTRAENTALLAHVTAKKIKPKDAVIMKNGREWDSGRLSRFERDQGRAGLLKADIHATAARIVAILDGYTLLTPPPNMSSGVMV